MINNENNSPFSVDYNEKVLEVKNLKKYFHVGVGRNKLTIPAVDDISFDVYKREVFGLVGESGCGKTTAARTIIKIYNATEGTVDLSGIRIGLGVDGFKNQIKMVKEAANEKISMLDPKKSVKLNLTKKYEHDILLANHEINSLIAEKKQQIKLVHDEINTANDVKYNLKNQEVIAIESAIYNYELGVNKIKREVKNEALEEYNNEVKMAEISFERKSEGLKESAALEKETILKRLEVLTNEYKEQLEELKTKFEPLIEAGKAKMLPKEEAKKMLAELKVEKKANVHKIKLEFSEKRAALVEVDHQAIKEKKAAVKAKYDGLIAKQKENIKDLKLKYKEDIKNIKIEPLTEEEQKAINEQIDAINSETDLKISEIRNKIIEGRNVNNSKETHEAAQRMQMIFQDPISSLNPRMTVKEIISEGLAIRGGYTSEELDQKVAEVLEIVGLLPEYAARYPHEFSGGQRQRIGIARALIMNPDFIIADEPISALDVSIRAQVLNLLSDLKEKLGLTILFIAHDLSVVRFFCDRIAVMYYGKIVEVATSEELFANPMHPYTISLLSAVPQPDPDYEKGRKRIHYNPSQHDYIINKPYLQEIAPGHLVYANDDEFKVMKEKYDLNNGKEGGEEK